MTELILNKIKQSTLNGNVFLSKTMTSNTSLVSSRALVPIDEKVDENNVGTNIIVDEEEIELPEYEKVKVVGRGVFHILTKLHIRITKSCSDIGSFGVAILYIRKSNQSYVVLKQINLINLTKMEKDLAMNEVDVFSKLHHPNIIW